jgi:carbonic anhydrase/acetyltransferase-like protein (isoleucine patch superfamily)
MTPIYPFDGAEPDIHESAFVAPTATIIGKATFGKDASAFYGVAVRADTAEITVGEGTNLQDNVVLHADPGHPCTLGDGISVGHSAVVHGCTVEDDCLIG